MNPPLEAKRQPGRLRTPSRELTGYLNAIGRGRPEAGDALMPHVYEELRAIAESYLGHGRARHSLQPTELIHEAFLRLFRPERDAWTDRHHFFALAARAMRHLLVDSAKRRLRLKRGAGRRPLTLDEALVPGAELRIELLDLDEALEELGRLAPRQARVVELRYFGGLGVDEVAAVMDVSRSTVEREWRVARAWLGNRLDGGE